MESAWFKRTPEAPKVPKLRLVTTRHETPGKPVEEPLERISHDQTKEIPGDEQAFMLETAARLIGTLETKQGGVISDRSRLHEDILEGARLQNVILRAMHSGRIKNFDRFARGFQEAATAFLGKEDFLIEGMPLGTYVTTMFDGILADKEVINRLEQSFNKRKPSPESQQFLATNDFLDARHRIDLVEISYKPGESAPVIERVWLIQVKRSKTPSDKLEKIHNAHEWFVRDLVSKGAYEIDRRSSEKKRALELFETQFSLKDIQPGVSAFLDEVVKAGGLVRSQVLEQLVAGATIPAPILKKWLAEPQAASVFKMFLEGTGMKTVRADAVYQQLSRWAAQHAPTQAEILSVLPPAKSAEEIVGAANFESIISHGKEIEKRPIVLSPGEHKALTAA